MNAASAPPRGPPHWANGPSFPPNGPPLLHPPRARPFFIREIYKNGFLKRLPHNERKSSALSKLMRSDRYWVVFSVHDEALPFLELWNEPTEVASKPPLMMYPLLSCQHISPSLVPADTEWTFVINFEQQSAVRFSVNSRSTMEEWVDAIRNKLGEMGVFNPRGNLYSKIGPNTPPISASSTAVVSLNAVTSRNPMSPLPEPPAVNSEPETASLTNGIPPSPSRTNSIIDVSDSTNGSFTTSIYLNQSPPGHSSASSAIAPESPSSPSSSGPTSFSGGGARPKVAPTGSSSVYLNNNSSSSHNGSSTSKTARHVTVIPINAMGGPEGSLNEPSPTRAIEAAPQVRRRSRRKSQAPDLHALSAAAAVAPTSKTSQENRRLSRRVSDCNSQRRRRTQRSSSLGPLLDDQHIASAIAGLGTRTNSLESVDSNPRQALAKSDRRAHYHRRPLPRIPPPGSESNVNNVNNNTNSTSSSNPVRFGSPPRPGCFPFPGSGIPPHIPLPGLTCHPSYLMPPNPGGGPPSSTVPPPPPPAQGQPPTPGISSPPQSLPNNVGSSSSSTTNSPPAILHPELMASSSRSPKEQQVGRLRQEIGHPAGVRLTLRKRDCINSIALVDFFGCLWVAGWKKHSDFPILYKAFHLGDQIVSMGSGGVPVRTASEFHKIVKQKTAEMHIEIIVRRIPFGQSFYIKRESESQPLGIVASNTNSDIKEIIPGSPASVHGMTSKIRSFDGQTFVPWCLTEINGRPLNILNKDGEAAERLANAGRELSIVIQPSDIISKLRKQLKSVKNYKEYLLI